MLNNPAQNPDTQRRQALARVYALLISLADEKEAAGVHAAEDESKGPKKATRETQNKDSKPIGPKQSKPADQDTRPEAEASHPRRHHGKSRTREK